MTLLRWWVLGCIRAYQRWLSPWKGYRCAQGVLHGESCSAAGLRIVQSQPPARWLPLLRQQFAACSAAASALEQDKKKPRKPSRRDRCADYCQVPDCSSCGKADKACDCFGGLGDGLPGFCDVGACCSGVRRGRPQGHQTPASIPPLSRKIAG